MLIVTIYAFSAFVLRGIVIRRFLTYIDQRCQQILATKTVSHDPLYSMRVRKQMTPALRKTIFVPIPCRLSVLQ